MSEPASVPPEPFAQVLSAASRQRGVPQGTTPWFTFEVEKVVVDVEVRRC